MSNSYEAVDQATLAKFEQLYDQHGQPAELDEAFVTEYFKSIKPDEAGHDHEILAPHKTTAYLALTSSIKTVKVNIPDKKKSFVVQHIASCACRATASTEILY